MKTNCSKIVLGQTLGKTGKEVKEHSSGTDFLGNLWKGRRGEKKKEERQEKHLSDISATVHEAFCRADGLGNLLECSIYWIIF